MLLVSLGQPKISSQTSGNCEAIGLSIHQGDEMARKEDGDGLVDTNCIFW